MAQHEPTERSPLLPQSSGLDANRLLSSPSPDLSGGTFAPGAPPIAEANERVQEQGNNGNDVERQAEYATNGSSSATYEGLPELRKKMKYIFPAMATGVFLCAADQTIIVASYGKIGSELNALSQTSWIASVYFLTLTAIQPLYGKLSDIFGRRSALQFAYIVFGLGCLFCGLARNIGELVAARGFAGIGGAGLTSVVAIIMSDIIPLRERGTYQGYMNIVYATGSAVGAPLGGLIADYLDWRWAFLSQVPICFIAFAAVIVFLDLPMADETHWRQKIPRVDFTGALLLLLSVASLLIGLDRESNGLWKDAATISFVVVSVPLFMVFALNEAKLAKEPFAPGHLIFARNMFAAFLCNMFSFGGWLAAMFYIPLHFQIVYNKSASQASVLLIPSILAGVIGSLFAGKYMQRTGRYYWLGVISYANVVVGMVIITLCSGVLVHSIPGMVVGMTLCAFGNGNGVTITLISIVATALREDQAVVVACTYLFRCLGIAIGVALSATAVNTTLRAELLARLGGGKEAERVALEVQRRLSSIRELEPKTQAIVRQAYSDGTTAAFALEIGIVFGAAVFAWWIHEARLSR